MWSRTFAGLVFGFLAAIALSSSIAFLTPAGWKTAVIPALTLFPLFWLGLFALAFTGASIRRTWTGLALTTLAAWIVLWLARGSG